MSASAGVAVRPAAAMTPVIKEYRARRYLLSILGFMRCISLRGVHSRPAWHQRDVGAPLGPGKTAGGFVMLMAISPNSRRRNARLPQASIMCGTLNLGGLA